MLSRKSVLTVPNRHETYEGESNENLKYFLKILFIVRKWYKAVSLFNIISPTLNASPPALTKCINSFRKKFLWQSAQLFMHRVAYLFIRTNL